MADVPGRSVVRILIAIAVLTFAVAAVGCGGADDEAEPTAAETATGGGADTAGATTETATEEEDPLAVFEQMVEDDFAAQIATQEFEPPDSGPEAVPGKTIVIIPCAMAAEGCARPARAAMEAAQTIGWEASIIDPAGDPSKMADAVRRAIVLGADGIALQAIDANVIQGALDQAKEAGIAITCFFCAAADVYDSVIPAPETFVTDGYTLGEAAYKLSGGDVKMVMMVDQEFELLGFRRQGTERFIEDCEAAGGDCQILDTQNFLIGELGTRVPQLAASLGRKNSDFNVFWADFDAGLNFMIQGLRQAGLTGDDAIAVSFDANVANLDLIRNDEFQRATIGLPMRWIGHAQIDDLNRIFADESPVDQGVHSKLLVKENVPEEGAWDGDMDVRPAYESIWGK